MESSVIASLIVAVIASLITSQLAFHRFRSQKGWERRAKAYDDVVIALHQMSLVLQTEVRAVVSGRVLSDKEQKKCNARYSEARLEVARVATLGGYILGSDARDELKNFLELKSDPNDSWGEVVINSQSETIAYLNKMIELARKDLGVNDAD